LKFLHNLESKYVTNSGNAQNYARNETQTIDFVPTVTKSQNSKDSIEQSDQNEIFT
jgi:hypothetical protein